MLHPYIKINITNVSEEERQELCAYLEERCWDWKRYSGEDLPDKRPTLEKQRNTDINDLLTSK